ncbi:MAG: Gfo/Idh/MocA family oxidoreductase [Microcoleus anatoxicus]|uniref:Gfo/Idh/MocA family oxidoreductase n=1 Tax=Microcoleus anatoxicus TaxID=2705319 RepID=UPI003672D781
MNIVIVGTGKAGFLHFKSYYDLAKGGTCDISKIYFIDRINAFGKELSNLLLQVGGYYKVYLDIGELISETKINPQDTIIDLCTPSGTFFEIIQKMTEYGFQNYIVEKPFIIFEDCEQSQSLIEKIKIIKIENYLHSKVHHNIRNFIDRYQLKLHIAVTNFSKDRRLESSKARAFRESQLPPSVFEIEIPHQLYICNNLFGDITDLVYVNSKDMVLKDRVLKDHGQGVIIGKNADGNLYIHYSNLCANRVYRYLDIFFMNNYYLHAIYAPICENLSGVEAGVVLFHGKELIESRFFNEADNNMLAMLSHAIQCFEEDKSEGFATWNKINSFSELMKNVLSLTNKKFSEGIMNSQNHDFDLMQLWFIQLFSNNKIDSLGCDFLDFIEKRKMLYFDGKIGVEFRQISKEEGDKLWQK